MKARKNSGFTLIELMVVIAIIGILSTMVSVSLQYARMKARDARRISDLTQIRTALEMYYLDHNEYPSANAANTYNLNEYTCSNGYWHAWSELGNKLRPYLSQMPTDPINTPTWPAWIDGYHTYCYGNVGDGNGVVPDSSPPIPTTDGYDLFTQLEDPLNPQRVGVRKNNFYFNNMYSWYAPGTYSLQLYEASLE